MLADFPKVATNATYHTKTGKLTGIINSKFLNL